MLQTQYPFRISRNDLYFEIHCTCPDEKWIGTNIEHIMKHKIVLTGYNDSNFFNNVNKESRESKCKCGRKFRYQWFPRYIIFEWID